jgi:hypothetical protein
MSPGSEQRAPYGAIDATTDLFRHRSYPLTSNIYAKLERLSIRETPLLGVYVIILLQIFFFFSDFNGLCQLTGGKLNIALVIHHSSKFKVQHHSHHLHERLMHD